MTSFILGASGQDGLYMVEHILSHGGQVVGLVRDKSKSAGVIPPHILAQIHLHEWDMKDQKVLESLLEAYKPTEVYNLAALSSGAGMFHDPVTLGEINGLAVARILESVLRVDPSIRFCQASSREIFGEAIESPQHEMTPVKPRSPYGAAKLYADSMVRIFRESHGLHACSAILFNHESPRRSLNFVTRKITHAAARVKLGLSRELHLGNLDALRDWGFAGDYVRAMWLMLRADRADDYVVATGEIHSVREFCEIAFARLDLDYRDYVCEDPAEFRPAEYLPLVGSSLKAEKNLGWRPEVGFHQLVHMMVDADLRNLQKRINRATGNRNVQKN